MKIRQSILGFLVCLAIGLWGYFFFYTPTEMIVKDNVIDVSNASIEIRIFEEAPDIQIRNNIFTDKPIEVPITTKLPAHCSPDSIRQRAIFVKNKGLYVCVSQNKWSALP